ncbi:MAG: hypothetical protein QOI13_828, partial [Paraburkholderia sp.]|nr:hypothetical protein [Paraburkholderia sp.]
MGVMGFLYTPLPLWVAVGAWAGAALLLALALARKPFKRLQDATLQHVWLAIIVAISVLWASNAWLEDGPVMHLLGATLFVTLFDWALALIAMAAVSGIAALVFDAAWHGVALTFLIYGALPVGVSALLQRACTAWLPRNLPVFIGVQGFLSPAIAVALTSAAAVGLDVGLAGGSQKVIPASYTL